jgi:PAS domain S-box-containing protein
LVEQQKEELVNVLLVDDDASLVDVAKLILKDMDQSLAVESAASVGEALHKLSTDQIDVVISDYEMPQRSGLDFLKELRAKNSKVPFILFTGKGREEIAIEALNLGADRYLNKNGNPEAVYRELTKSIHVLHERASAQKKLLESEEKLRLFMENAADAIFVCDMKGRFLDVNRELEALTDYSKQEMLGRDMFELGLFPESAIPQLRKFLAEVETNQKIRPSAVEIRRKDGSIAVAEVSLFSSKRDGTIELLGIARDITQRKTAESELVQKYEALERVTKSLDCALAIIGRDYRVVWANSILQKKLVDRNKHCYQLFNNLDRVCPNCGVKKVFEGNVNLDRHEYEFKDSTGKPMCVELRVTPLKGKNGEVVGAIELGVPITERKKAEQELRESEERYAKLTAAAFEGILISRNGVILDANNQFAKTHQYEVSELIGKQALILIDPKDRARVDENMRSGFEGHYELLALRRDGSSFPVEVRAKSINYNGAPARVSTVLDITGRKKREEQVRILSSLFELASDAIFVCDTDGRIVYFNEATYKTAGYTKEEMARMSLYAFCSVNSAKLVKERIERIIENNGDVFESEHMRRDGTIIPCEVSARVIESEGSKLILNVARDITERKKAEAGLAAVNEKLRVVGKLTRHDVRNKLATISSNIYLLRKQYGGNPEIVRYLDSIDSAVTLSNRLFDFTSLYEKIGAQEQTQIDIEKCFDEAVALFPNMSGIKVFNEAHGLVVVADSLLRQIFYNLVDNSLRHGKGVTEIHLHYAREKNQTRLYYEDNGVGVPDKNKLKIFAEHFTTNGGTGLGMSAIRKIMEVYNWTILETGTPGKGVRFEINIPAATGV